MSGAAYALGIVLLAICVVTSLMLALEHFGGLRLPGCGEGSPCAEASASVWGKIPGINWPVSFLGLAYFLGVLGAWLGARRGVPVGLRYLVRCGVMVSLGFVVIMLVGGYLCTYCLVTHLANVAWWIIVEHSSGARTGSARVLATAAVVFAVSSGVLGAKSGRSSGERSTSTSAIWTVTI